MNEDNNKKQPIILCACGCGQPVKTKGAKYVCNHNKRTKSRPVSEYGVGKCLFRGPSFTLGFCACGCGTEIDIRSYGLLRRYEFNHHQKKGEENQNWKGGRFEDKEYIYCYRPDHPYATKAGYVVEHRLVMEEYLGRYLDPMEIVHHRDRNRKNNKIENLMVYVSQSKHMSMEHNPEKDMSDRVCVICGSNTTGIQKKSNGKSYPKWFVDKTTGGFECKKCHDGKRNWKGYKKRKSK